MTALGEDLLGTVNKLQDLVFNTIGNDSLDLPQIVCQAHIIAPTSRYIQRSIANQNLGRSRVTVFRKVVGTGKHCWQRFLTPGKWHSDEKTLDSTTHQRTF